jgi:hypothetical protein
MLNQLPPCIELLTKVFITLIFLFNFFKSLDVFQRSLGMEHPRTVICRRNLKISQDSLLAIPRKLPTLPPVPKKLEWEDPTAKKKKKKK